MGSLTILEGVHNPSANGFEHMHLAGVVQEGGVEAAAHGIVAPEAECNVGHASADLAPRADALQLPCRPAASISACWHVQNSLLHMPGQTLHARTCVQPAGKSRSEAVSLRVSTTPLSKTRACAPDEVHSVVVVLRQAGADGQDVGVEDDVLRVEPDVLHEDAVCPLADAHLQYHTENSL